MADARGSETQPVRVSTLELFFDLVFVFTITQLTELLEHEGLGRGAFEAALVLAIIFYMYGGYAWLTNAVALDTGPRRAGLLAGMLGYLILALSVPDAFGDAGLVFGIAYVFIVLLHLGLYQLTSWEGSRAGIRAVAPSNLLGAALVLAGGIAGDTAQEVLWAAAVLVMWVVPLLGSVGSFTLEPAHFIERHGLVVIVAIGESVVAIGLGARGLEVDLVLVAVAGLALTLNALLWWTYFGGDDERATAAFAAMPVERRGRAALIGYGHAHLIILAGVIAVAAGLAEVVAHPGEALEAAPALELAAGAALFLVGEAGLRAALSIGRAGSRALGAVVLLVSLPLGLEGSGALMLSALVVLYGLALVLDGRVVRPA